MVGGLESHIGDIDELAMDQRSDNHMMDLKLFGGPSCKDVIDVMATFAQAPAFGPPSEAIHRAFEESLN